MQCVVDPQTAQGLPIHAIEQICPHEHTLRLRQDRHFGVKYRMRFILI